MVNPYIVQRLQGLLAGLNATYAATAASASASKGAGRANFIDSFLRQVIPPNWRVSTGGEITNTRGMKTGELDIIVENGFFPSLPVIGIESTRLFLAEGVAAVIEIKSDLRGQWEEVLSTGQKLREIDRQIGGGIAGSPGGPIVIQVPGDFSGRGFPKFEDPQMRIRREIPYFVVGYTGWSTAETVKAKLDASEGTIAGVLQLDLGYFASSAIFRSVEAQGAVSLFCFLNSLSEAASYIKTTSVDLLQYVS